MLKTPSFERYYPKGLRFWHWLNAFIVFGLLATVGFRKTVLSKGQIAEVISLKATEANTPISPDLIQNMAKSIRNLVWDWHYVLGYLLAGLLGLRIFIALYYRDFPIKAAWVGVRACVDCPIDERREALHYTLVKFGYLAFYLVSLVMVLTGFAMRFSKEIALPKSAISVIHSIHEFLLWFFITFVVVHLIGVILGEVTRYRGIVSNMIHGGRK